MTPVVGFTYASSFAIPCRKFFFATITMDPALAAGTYYVCLLDAASAPANSIDLSQPTDATHPRVFAILPVVHALNAAEPFTLSAAAFGYRPDSGYTPATAGVVLYLTSTGPTSITASVHMWLAMSGTS